MQEIETYKLTWTPADNRGTLHLGLKDGTGADIALDSPSEAHFLMDLLRNESPCYYYAAIGMVGTGFEPVGEGEEQAA